MKLHESGKPHVTTDMLCMHMSSHYIWPRGWHCGSFPTRTHFCVQPCGCGLRNSTTHLKTCSSKLGGPCQIVVNKSRHAFGNACDGHLFTNHEAIASHASVRTCPKKQFRTHTKSSGSSAKYFKSPFAIRLLRPLHILASMLQAIRPYVSRLAKFKWPTSYLGIRWCRCFRLLSGHNLPHDRIRPQG